MSRNATEISESLIIYMHRYINGSRVLGEYIITGVKYKTTITFEISNKYTYIAILIYSKYIYIYCKNI